MNTNISERPNSWPLPPASLQVALCLLTFCSAYAFGRAGVAVALVLVVLMPTRRLLSLFRQGDFSDVVAVYLGTMILANIDALAVLFNNQEGEEARGSWFIVLATIPCALYRLPKLRNEFIPALLLFVTLFLMRVLSAGDELMQAGLRQAAYFFALILFLTLLVSKNSREALVEKLVLVVAASAGHLTCEMAFPDSGLSISSTQYEGVVGRAAGLYANAVNAGIMLGYIALLACLICSNAPRDRKDKLRLVTLHLICLGGIGMTFSRQAVLIIAFPLLIVATKVSGSGRARLGKVGLVVFLALVMGLAVVFLGFELISQTDQGLSRDAKARYASLKHIVTFGLLSTDKEETEIQKDRLENLWDSSQYWSDPSLLGLGQDMMKREIPATQVPHNQFIMILIEDGYLGALLFVLALAACIGTRWSTHWKYMLSAAVAMLAFTALAIGTYNLFDYRFFALPVAMLMWVCLTLPVADKRSLRLPIAARGVSVSQPFNCVGGANHAR